MPKKVIDIDAHAFFRMVERGIRFGLNLYETQQRAFQTVRAGKCSNYKHKSKHHTTYYSYFHDNLSFYVVCKEKLCESYIKVLIKTIIVERGRE